MSVLLPLTGKRMHFSYAETADRHNAMSLCGRTREWSGVYPDRAVGALSLDWPLCSVCERIRAYQEAHA